MRALLLAAGHGTRLRPLTERVPKCLVPIAGRPLLDYWLERLFACPDIERVLINTHWLAEQVAAHVGASAWRSRIDLVHEPELLGTGGTILANAGYFRSEPFLTAHADNLTAFDLDDFLARHRGRPAGAAMSMLSFRTDDPRSCGILELDERAIVRRFHEKVAEPPGNLANAAVYILEPEVVDFAASLGRPVVDLSTEVIPHFVGRIYSVETPSYHRDIGTPESLAHAERDFALGLRGNGLSGGSSLV
ncbi:nucleotidyltransferase family protein [Methylobacterium sp. 1973]|uniref:nucleotidyltransferase family protein n=1 Tax=Methylobacterium sp. 1973 TaxID=3156421 RepID=UPI0033918CF7